MKLLVGVFVVAVWITPAVVVAFLREQRKRKLRAQQAPGFPVAPQAGGAGRGEERGR